MKPGALGLDAPRTLPTLRQMRSRLRLAWAGRSPLLFVWVRLVWTIACAIPVGVQVWTLDAMKGPRKHLGRIIWGLKHGA